MGSFHTPAPVRASGTPVASRWMQVWLVAAGERCVSSRATTSTGTPRRISPDDHPYRARWRVSSLLHAGLTRAADQRPGRPAQRSPLPVVRVSPVCLMSGCLWGAREVASRQGQSRRRLVPRRPGQRVCAGDRRRVPAGLVTGQTCGMPSPPLVSSSCRGQPQPVRTFRACGPEGDVGMVEGDLLICCEPQPRAGRRRRGKQGECRDEHTPRVPCRHGTGR